MHNERGVSRGRAALRSALLLCAVVIAVLLARRAIPDAPFSYDESDYMYVASRGMWANWADSPSQSLADFLRAGLSQLRSGDQRGNLSERIRALGDIHFYRHWHGPFYWYWLIAIAHPLRDNESLARLTTVAFHVAAFLLVYFGAHSLYGPLAAALAGAVFLFNPDNLTAAGAIAPHSAYALLYLAALLAMAYTIRSGEWKYFYAASVLSAAALCTLEIGTVLVPVLAATYWLAKPKLGAARARPVLARAAAAYIATMLALWPMSILNGGIVKAWAFLGYLAYVRKGSWGGLTPTEVWIHRFQAAPLEWAFVLAGLGVFFCSAPLRRDRALWPLLIYCGLALLALLRVVADEARYVVPYLPALQVIAAISIASVMSAWKPAFRRGAAAVVVLLALATTVRATGHRNVAEDHARRQFVDFMVRAAPGHRWIIPQGQRAVMHYYAPGLPTSTYLEESQIASVISDSCDSLIWITDRAGTPEPAVLARFRRDRLAAAGGGTEYWYYDLRARR